MKKLTRGSVTGRTVINEMQDHIERLNAEVKKLNADKLKRDGEARVDLYVVGDGFLNTYSIPAMLINSEVIP